MRSKYRIVLSVDGGGIRGLIPLRILTYLQHEINAKNEFYDPSTWVDVFAGSSTGSIVSGALMLKDEKGQSIYMPSDLQNLYVNRGEQLFNRTEGYTAKQKRYPLRFVLDKYFEGIKLDEVANHFLFVSYDMQSEKQVLFTDSTDQFRKVDLSTVLKACCAYPGIFPPVELGSYVLADGMLVTKNPAKLAYDYARLFYQNDPIILLSFGTGKERNETMDIFDLETDRIHRSLILEAEKDRNLIYYRFQPELEEVMGDYDHPSKEVIDKMIEGSDWYIKENQGIFNELLSLVNTKLDQLYG